MTVDQLFAKCRANSRRKTDFPQLGQTPAAKRLDYFVV